MDEKKIQVVCTDDYTAYFDVTDASWHKGIFITDILACCDGKIRGTYNTIGYGENKKILNATHWKYYDKSMEGMVTWVDCLSVTRQI